MRDKKITDPVTGAEVPVGTEPETTDPSIAEITMGTLLPTHPDDQVPVGFDIWANAKPIVFEENPGVSN